MGHVHLRNFTTNIKTTKLQNVAQYLKRLTTTRIANIKKKTIREQTGQPQTFWMVKCQNHVIFDAQYAAFQLKASLIICAVKFKTVCFRINIFC